MALATRMARLGTEKAFEVLAQVRALEAQGRDIVHLQIGEPDFDTPVHIRDAAKAAIDAGYTHYSPAPGLMELREAVARHQTKWQGYEVDPNSVVVVPGAKPTMFFVITALVNEGDEVIYPNPGFPIYESMINFVGGKAVPLQLNEESGFNADIEDLRSKANKNTKLIVLVSPSNPCGSVIPPGDLEQIAKVAVDVDAYVLSDEVYKDFYYEGEHHSISQFPGMRERTIILDGFSKSYAMTGWRLGYSVLPDFMVEPVSRLAINAVSCTAGFTQMAGVAALDGPQEPVREMVAEFARRREVIVEGLNSIDGITCQAPKGAFYVFPNIRGTGMTSDEFANGALQEAGVAVLSGTAFGAFGEGYLRLSFANSVENIQEAIRRLKGFAGGGGASS